jgi:hypothetical protein
MALDLIYGTDEEKSTTAKMLMDTDIDEMENILEVSREVAFDNTGDERLLFAVTCLIDYIYLTLGIRAMKGSDIRNAH